MINVVPFEREHIENVDLHWIYNTDPGAKQRWLEMSDYLLSLKTGSTIMYHDLILGIVIFVPLYSGVSEVWTLASTHIHTYRQAYFSTIKRGIKIFMEAYGLHRVHGTIRADVKFADKWISVLGFEKEGLLRNYGPSGEDHFMFARIR